MLEFEYNETWFIAYEIRMGWGNIANNHYVPKLILRNFDERISVFNLKTNSLQIDKNLRKVFSRDCLWPDEIEKMFNEIVESKVSIILRKKILVSEDRLKITRDELILLRKFLLLQMFRALHGDNHFTLKAINKYRAVAKNPPISFFETEEITALNITEYWFATLKCILECDDVQDLKTNKLATAIAVCFAEGYSSGYMGIWDSTNCGEDFFVMDQGMTSEHEKAPTEYRFEDAMKRGYLLRKLYEDHPDKETYARIFVSNNLFHENFYFHSISKTRAIVLINPFFNLYNSIANGGGFERPDIWPTNIRDMKLVQKNKVNYSKEGTQSLDDEFVYEVKQLSLRDAIYVNALTLDRIQEEVGFSEIGGIRRSLIVYNALGIYKLKNVESFVREIDRRGYSIKITDELQYITNSIILRIITKKEISYIECFMEFLKEDAISKE